MTEQPNNPFNVDFTEEELQLILRVIYFAEGDLPISNGKGNNIYPVASTIAMAKGIIDKLKSADVKVKAGLYSPFDPNEILGRTATVRQDAKTDDDYTILVRGKVTKVVGSDNDGWYVELGETTLGPYRREELKESAQVELDLSNE